MKNYSSGGLLRKFKEINWNELSDIDDVHKVKATFESIIDKITPVNDIRLRQRTGPCMTNAIFDFLRESDHSLNHLKKNNSEDLYRTCCNLRNREYKIR